jgi:hypothetical protein
MNSPRPASTDGKSASAITSPLKQSFNPDISVSDPDGVIHVDNPGRRRSVMFSDDETTGEDDEAPILAADEVAKNPDSYDFSAAVEPPSSRRGSVFEIEEPSSRPTSRPASIYKESSFEMHSTPLEDVEEYEPLFPEDEKAAKKPAHTKRPDDLKHKFPSRDIWEDAPNSVHYTAEVSTPDIPEDEAGTEEPPRDTETPAQKFAREQEELAEKEARDPVYRKGRPLQAWERQGHHLAKEATKSSSTNPTRPSMVHRFPSRDVWEDTPDSLKLETTVESSQSEDSPAEVSTSPSDSRKPEVPQRPARKSTDPSSATSDKGDRPTIPERPKPKSTLVEENVSKPVVPDRPKPQVPARPAKQLSGSDKDAEASAPRSKPAVPVRPAGGKIAALQAGFMSDLNKRLQLGPQAPKKEEAAAEDLTEEKEKAPLSDARKGRARGPQRRAPRSSPSPGAAKALDVAPQKPTPSLAFSITTTLYSIDPDEGTVKISNGRIKGGEDDELPQPEEPEMKTETLASNTAGETIVETKLEEDTEHNVETAEASEVAKD